MVALRVNQACASSYGPSTFAGDVKSCIPVCLLSTRSDSVIIYAQMVGVTLEQTEVLNTSIQGDLGKYKATIHVEKWIILYNLVKIPGIG